MAQKPSLFAAQAMLRANSEDAPQSGRHIAAEAPSRGSQRNRAPSMEELQDRGEEHRDSPQGKPMIKDPKAPTPFKPSLKDMRGGGLVSINGTGDAEGVGATSAEEAHPRSAPRPGPREAPIVGGKARVHAPKGSRTAIVLEIGGEALAAELSVLEEEGCDTDEYVHTKCGTLEEEKVRLLYDNLAKYKRVSIDEMQQTVHENYELFIRYKEDITLLEVQLRSLKTFLVAQSAVLRALLDRPSLIAERAQKQVTALALQKPRAADDEDVAVPKPDAELLAIPDQLVVCLAERNFPHALHLLAQAEGGVLALRTRIYSGEVQPKGTPSLDALDSLEAELQERREDLMGLLADQTRLPAVSTHDLQYAVAAIAALGNPKRAHRLLLDAHSARTRGAVHEQSYAGGPPQALNYTARVAGLFASGVYRAAADSSTVFGHTLEFSSDLVLWANAEAEWLCARLRRAVLAPAALSGALRLAAECGRAAVAHCAALEEHGLSLGPRLLHHLLPTYQRALESHIRRIQDSCEAEASREDWSLQAVPASSSVHQGHSTGNGSVGIRMSGSSSLDDGATTLHLTSSARRLYDMVQDLLGDVGLLAGAQLVRPAFLGVQRLFRAYLGLLGKARLQWPPENADDWQEATALNAVLIAAASRGSWADSEEGGRERGSIGRGSSGRGSGRGSGRWGEGLANGGNRSSRGHGEGDGEGGEGNGEGGEWNGEGEEEAEDEMVRPGNLRHAATERQQLALIANATVLWEELPRLALRLTQPTGGPGGGGAEGGADGLPRSMGRPVKRWEVAEWRREMGEEVDDFRLGFSLQAAMKVLYPDPQQEHALLPHLYFYLDTHGFSVNGGSAVADGTPTSGSASASASAPLLGDGMPTQTMQDFLRAVLSLQERGCEVLRAREALVLSLLTHFGLALLDLVCHDPAWEDPLCVLGPVGLQRYLLDLMFLQEVAARYHFSTRRLQQEAGNAMERARSLFDKDGTCPDNKTFKDAAQVAIQQMLSEELGPTDNDNLGRDF